MAVGRPGKLSRIAVAVGTGIVVVGDRPGCLGRRRSAASGRPPLVMEGAGGVFSLRPALHDKRKLHIYIKVTLKENKIPLPILRASPALGSIGISK